MTTVSRRREIERVRAPFEAAAKRGNRRVPLETRHRPAYKKPLAAFAQNRDALVIAAEKVCRLTRHCPAVQNRTGDDPKLAIGQLAIDEWRDRRAEAGLQETW